jgi:hypothetical protein
MSMKGDLPGLSNFCPGTIGSCQYSTRFPVDGSTSPTFNARDAFVPGGAAPRALEVTAISGIPLRARSSHASNAAYAPSARTALPALKIANARLARPDFFAALSSGVVVVTGTL